MTDLYAAPPHDAIPAPTPDLATGWETLYWQATKRAATVETAIRHIRDYVTEAAKTPITRESIAATEAKVDDITVLSAINFLEQSKTFNYSDEVGILLDALKAQTLTARTQYDEMQGLCRLVLSETGEGK